MPKKRSTVERIAVASSRAAGGITDGKSWRKTGAADVTVWGGTRSAPRGAWPEPKDCSGSGKKTSSSSAWWPI